MLSKLIKHEWKSTWKLPTGLCIFVLATAGLGCLGFQLPMWDNIVNNRYYAFTFFDILSVAVLITYFLAIIITAFTVTIYFAIRFYKNLFTDEGYLMHTLPVTSGQLIVSKGIVSIFWNFISTLLLLCSIILLLFAFFKAIIPNGQWGVFTDSMQSLIPRLEAVFIEYSGMNFMVFSLFYLLFTVIGCFSSTALIYLCIGIGQLFRKHKVAASVISYMVASGVIQLLTTIAVLPFSFRMFFITDTAVMTPETAIMAPFASLTPIFYVVSVLFVIFTVICYFVTRYLIKEKLNLD